jgi:hypothetical protein
MAASCAHLSPNARLGCGSGTRADTSPASVVGCLGKRSMIPPGMRVPVRLSMIGFSGLLGNGFGMPDPRLGDGPMCPRDGLEPAGQALGHPSRLPEPTLSPHGPAATLAGSGRGRNA